ncbi:MAG TPA: tetratricopeptide repeat protein, partial [Bryobacteraceae bacterium]|nr:tetratricopeptide repeat protein [Bryobacteraceae bacterium]
GDPDAKGCFQRLTHTTDPGIAAEGFWGLKDYQSANNYFRAANKAKPKDPYVRTRWGRMYLEHWQKDEAGKMFAEALEMNQNYAPALLGVALMAADGFEGKASELAEKALKADPKLVEAQELLAWLALEDNNPEKAAAAAKKALEISSEALDAMSILASIEWLDDKTPTQWIDRISKINPRFGELYETAGHFFVINRRYEEGIRSYRKAIEIDPELNSARSQLGINLMRFGKEEEARKLLEQTWANGFQDTPTKNSLMLLDTFKNFQTFKTPNTILFLNKKEQELVRPYMQQELDRAMATFEKKYKIKLGVPVQLEVYPNHEDFAVRTMGMPGLGALGVTFGNVVAMDSPSGRKPGQFHWASTLWHELSHVYALAVTNHRVPRWFTEGLAVYEETAAAPDWGDRLDPEAINAIKTKKLLPVAELDRGFIHPTYPSQVIVSYFQGGKICDFIAEKWGYDKLQAMLRQFAKRKTTTEVITEELGMSPQDFDKQFLPWLEAQTKRTIEGFDEWRKKIKAVSEFAKLKAWDDVIKTGEAIRDLYPDYVEAGSVYEFLSEAWIAKGNKPKAMAELEKYSKVGGRAPVSLKLLAAMQTEAGKKKEAAATLERLTLIYLKDDELHKRLGDLSLELGNSKVAIREFQALIASGTTDAAGANYELARAFKAAGRTDDAREAVLNSLEAAPGYKPAQKLLLELKVKQ